MYWFNVLVDDNMYNNLKVNHRSVFSYVPMVWHMEKKYEIKLINVMGKIWCCWNVYFKYSDDLGIYILK